MTDFPRARCCSMPMANLKPEDFVTEAESGVPPFSKAEGKNNGLMSHNMGFMLRNYLYSTYRARC